MQVTLRLVDQHDIQPGQGRSGRRDLVLGHAALHREALHDTSSSFSDCVLSLPYTVAAAISDRTFGIDQLARERIGDRAVHELAARVKVRADEEMDTLYPREWPVLVEIAMKTAGPSASGWTKLRAVRRVR